MQLYNSMRDTMEGGWQGREGQSDLFGVLYKCYGGHGYMIEPLLMQYAYDIFPTTPAGNLWPDRAGLCCHGGTIKQGKK